VDPRLSRFCHPTSARTIFRFAASKDSGLEGSRHILDKRRGVLLVRAPPGISIYSLDSRAPRISSLGVSMGEMRVRALVLGEEATMVVVAMGIGVASVVLSLVGVSSVTMSVDMGLDVSLLDGLLVGVVVLAVDVLSLSAIGVLGLAVAAVALAVAGATTVVGGVSNACNKGKSDSEGVHFI